MKVDAHQHFWKYAEKDYPWIAPSMHVLRRSFLPADLKPLLDESNIDGCIAVQARQSEEENEFLLDLAARKAFIKGIVGWVDFQDAGVEERLAHYSNYPIFKGFRHIVQDEPDDDFILRPRFIEGVKHCRQFNFVYDILVYERQMPAVLRFLDNFDDQVFVLDHIGKPVMQSGPSRDWIDGIYAIAQYPSIYCKVSGMITEAQWPQWTYRNFAPYLEVIVDAFGQDRIMVGSDWPVCLLADCEYSAVIDLATDIFNELGIGRASPVYGDTAKAVYRL